MSTNKGKIMEDMKIELDRPRDRKSEGYKYYKEKLTLILTKSNPV
ncbi:hypothetical protein TICRE_12370 [Tissierella creatinophila DSM 6911]|uniref:Uncharacterized protein n=1 Tax=Tissierella creatinophila DSM 6911 TaxID=1123403 RepID=A0A1U7M605_TISCR|nr:hypothetical protein TICRE_12370 [Tissierella creatinophila DSM 6911]